jgi:D-alanine transaminase/branched-chain amino acid aminotransferase
MNNTVICDGQVRLEWFTALKPLVNHIIKDKFFMLKYILNDRLVEASEAFVHIGDLALLRGYGIFDFFRLQGKIPLFIDEHIDRFFNSANVLRLESPLSKQSLKKLILEMIDVNSIENSGVRLVLTGGESKNGYDIGTPTLFAINEPITPLPETHFSKGVKLLSCEYLRDIPYVKTINYAMGIYKLPEIRNAGAMDVLYHWKGYISELTRSNFFIVNTEGKIITPGDGILMGITRKHVIELAKKKYDIEERPIHLDEVYAASEAFITGTTKKVMPVYQIDQQLIGKGTPGPITKGLQKVFEIYVERYLKANDSPYS